MYYAIYKITNLVNGKIYIGTHRTKSLENSYMGSGLLIRKAVKTYGVENFKKEYIEVFDNPTDMWQMEAKLVNEEFLRRDDVYNIALGGVSGLSFNAIINHTPLRQKINAKLWSDPSFRKRASERASKTFHRLHKEGKITAYGFKDKHHTEETKQRIGKANSIHQQGSGNSQYGTCWIFNLELKENKRIKREELQEWLQKGWVKGRKMSKCLDGS